MAVVRKIGMKELTKELGKEKGYLNKSTKELYKGTLRGCLRSIPEATRRSPVHTGFYASSWVVDSIDNENKKEVFFGNTAPYAEKLEFGSGAFEAPIEPLLDWASKKLGKPRDHPDVEHLAWGIKRKYAKEGSEPKGYLERITDEVLLPNIKKEILREDKVDLE